MREDTSFADRKLTEEEFAEKYWLGGEAPYQYHTGTIEDGRDEREQFVFNNIRALYELMKAKDRMYLDTIGSLSYRVERLERLVEWIKCIGFSLAMTAIIFLVIMLLPIPR